MFFITGKVAVFDTLYGKFCGPLDQGLPDAGAVRPTRVYSTDLAQYADGLQPLTG